MNTSIPLINARAAIVNDKHTTIKEANEKSLDPMNKN